MTIEFDGHRVVEFNEKSQAAEGWINVPLLLEPGVIDYIDGDDVMFEYAPMQRLQPTGNNGIRHESFWQCMDTLVKKRFCSGCGTAATRPGNLEGPRSMKVLLTGNRGYIGAVLALMLLERNHSVVEWIVTYRSCNFAASCRGADHREGHS